ncbi:MAG: cation:proton antiporter [Candidatus Hadarchaeales archaeon]
MDLSILLFYLAMCLLLARIGGILATKLRQPSLLGEICAGIIAGPSVAGLISSHLIGTRLCIDLQSPAGEWISSLAEIGALILLFLAGLSLELREIKKYARPSLTTAVFGALWAFLLGFATIHILGWSFLTAAFAGGILVATSVGITVETLMELGKLHSRSGVTILGAAVIDDIIGIIFLSVLSGIALGTLSVVGVFETLLLMIIFFVAVIIFGLKIIPKIFSRVSLTYQPEMSLSLALVLIFLISGIAQKVQIAAITGAFLTGLFIGRTPVSRPLKDIVSTLGYGFLIPLFFFETGLWMDIWVLGKIGPAVLLFLLAAFVSKIVGCGLGAMVGGLGRKDGLRIGIGMLPRAEVALIIASIGIKIGAVGPDLFSMTIVTILVTSLLTPFLLKTVYAKNSNQHA